MSTDAETLADRRRLRRKLSFWRVLGVLALIAAVAAIGFTVEGRTGWRAGPQIARVSIGGFISGDQRMSDLLRRVGESASVSGVVISINSPGGSVTGAEELFQNIRALAAKKPTVAFVDGTAASPLGKRGRTRGALKVAARSSRNGRCGPWPRRPAGNPRRGARG